MTPLYIIEPFILKSRRLGGNKRRRRYCSTPYKQSKAIFIRFFFINFYSKPFNPLLKRLIQIFLF